MCTSILSLSSALCADLDSIESFPFAISNYRGVIAPWCPTIVRRRSCAANAARCG